MEPYEGSAGVFRQSGSARCKQHSSAEEQICLLVNDSGVSGGVHAALLGRHPTHPRSRRGSRWYV